jgi:RimJ/RimL family protein N-acetyltransferase
MPELETARLRLRMFTPELVDDSNAGSQRVMEKIGMKHQGLTDRYFDTELAC